MSALDELVRSWRANPDAEGTIALCATLGGEGAEELMEEVRGVADAWHADNYDVMLAVGRMFLDAGALVEAQAALVSAGKADGRRAEAFRYLGEVLLRRGDAERAEKVFERAARLGAADADLRLWHDRARVYGALQKRLGLEAVAREVARAVPRAVSLPPPAMSRAAAPGAVPRGVPPGASVRGAAPAASARGAAPVAVSAPSPRAAAPRLPASAEPRLAPSPRNEAPTELGELGVSRFPAAPAVSAAPAVPAAPRAPAAIAASSLAQAAPGAQVVPAAPAAATPDRAAASDAPAFSPIAAAPAARQPFPESSFESSLSPYELQADRAAKHMDDGELPPHEVLAHLVQVGVFEPQGGVQPAWEKPPREPGRRLWVLGALALLAAGGAVSGTFYARHLVAQRLAEASALGDAVSRELRSGSPTAVEKTDQELSRAFDLDPGSQRTARLWLENRVMHWLVRGAMQGIEGAMQRARQVDVPAEQLAFGSLALRLADGDVPGALSLLSTWDAKANSDGKYQLLAGLALERAGNADCLSRYDVALAAEPDLRIARVLRARALLLLRGPSALTDALSGIDAESSEAKALRVLAALPSSTTPSAAPTEDVDAWARSLRTEELPVALRWIGVAWQARSALAQGKRDEARAFIASALSAVDTADAAVRLARLALAADDRALLGKATLHAIALSPVHVPARLLVARLAAERGHFDDALKAMEGIDPKLDEVVGLRAVVAYERGDAVALGDAVDALSTDVPDAFGAVRLLPALLVGGSLPKNVEVAQLSLPEVIWGRAIALDVALRRGELAEVQRQLEALGSAEPPLALRQARALRLAREASPSKVASATDSAAGDSGCLPHSARALDAGPSLLSLTERISCLLTSGDAATARSVLEQYPAVLGATGGWLGALVDMAQDRAARAKARVATLELPPAESPLALRVVVARALVAVGDRKRAAPLLAELRRVAPLDPAVVALPRRP